MYSKKIFILSAAIAFSFFSCKKKGCTDINANNYNVEAKKDDGTCTYDPPLTVPSTYSFTDASGNNTVSYSGQTDRINQLSEMNTYLESGTSTALNVSVLHDMFENTGDNGGGNFSFSSTKQLKNKCFSSDVTIFEDYFDSIAVASIDYAMTASNGQAGTLTTGSSTYLVAANGIEYRTSSDNDHSQPRVCRGASRAAKWPQPA